MSIKSSLRALGLPALDGQASLFYQIGAAAMTLAILCLLSWLSVTFGNQLKFSFSWILDAALIVLYVYHRTNILLLIATAFSLILLTLIGLLIGSPFTSIFGLIIFLVLLAGGWFLQDRGACHSAGNKQCINKALFSLLFSPLSYTAYLLEKLKFLDLDKE
jgi:hypothetical protein